MALNFVTKLDASGSALVYSTYAGGGLAGGIAVDAFPVPNAYMTGTTLSADFPTTSGAFDTSFNGGDGDAFVAKINLNARPTLRAAQAGGNVQLQWAAFAPEFALESNTNLALPANWTVVAPAPPPTNGWHTLTLPATNSADFFRLKR